MDPPTQDLETDCGAVPKKSEGNESPESTNMTHSSLPEGLRKNLMNNLPQESSVQLSTENLVSILTEKDQDLAQEKEKVKQLEEALERTENRMANIMKVQLNLSQEFHSLPLKLDSGKSGTSDKNQTDSTLRPRGLADANEGQTESMANMTSQLVLTPGISKTMFDNVVRENVKMKKTVRELLKKEGMDVKMFMETKELEEVIKKLREDLFQKQGQVDQLERLIQNSSDEQSPALLQQLTELQLKVPKLEKGLAAKSQLVDSLSQECDKLRGVCTQLKSKADSLEVENQKLQSQISSTPRQNVEELGRQRQEFQQVLENYRKEIGNLQGHLKQEIIAREKLQLQCQEYAASYQELQARQPAGNMPLSHIELREQITQLEQERDLLHYELKKTMEEKSLIETQNEFFREDFATEQREKQKQKQKYELFISQQQMQIRQLITENEKFHKHIQELSKSKNKQSAPYMAGCSAAISSPLPLNTNREVMADGPGNMQQEEEVELECPRCMRQFTDYQKFTEHTQKCTDS
ncbi:interaptin [Lingula anatina]|uniref:Interaptin n=1 Tax=Lingula anatina TaxID=7574 RepID=A0A1S3IDK0_LINAN|nr:interaptin [Lingula anatina]|eukprot:XP_013396340.1 interaptin [Lingula anatina]